MLAFDAASSGTDTWSHTCTGSNGILFVAVGDLDHGAVTGVTYNGVSMTQVDSQLAIGGNIIYLTGWMLVNPSTGAHNIVIQDSNGSNRGNIGAAASYTVAKQTSQPDSHANNTNGSNLINYAYTTTVVDANCWVIGMAANYINPNNVISSGNPSLRATIRDGSNTKNVAIGDSNGIVPPGSYSGSFTDSAGPVWVSIAISVLATNSFKLTDTLFFSAD